RKELILKKALFAGLFLAALAVVVLMLVVLSQWFPRHVTEETTAAPTYPLCETDDCVAHAAALTVKDPKAGTPCFDFGRFVCSAWTKRVAVAGTLTEQLLMESLLAMTRLKANSSVGELMDRPADFMAFCKVARPEKDSAGVESFKQFLRREANFLRGGAATYAKLLEALVVLSGKWFVPLWFRFDHVAATKNSRFITIKPEPLTTLWRKLHGTLKTYAGFVEQFIRVIYDNGTASVPTSYLHFLRTESAEVQTKVLKWMSVAETDPHPMPVSGSLSDLEEFAPRFTANDWTLAASKVLGFNVGEHYGVFVSSTTLLSAMDVATRALSAQQLLYHTVWWFVQQVGALTSNSLFETATFALGESSTLYQGLLCGIQVSLTYNILLASQHAANLPDDARTSVMETLNVVHSETSKVVRSSKTLGKPRLDWIYFMLLETQPVVWPLAPNFEPADLPRLYGESVDNSRGFFGHWRSSHEGLAKNIGGPYRSAAAQFYHLDTTSLTFYEPILKGIAVSTAAIQPPLYYGAGTEAMRYGGLGFAYADRLVRSMNVRTLLHAAAFAVTPVAELKDRLLEGMLCSDRNEKLKAFPFLPALALAYAAYNKTVNGTDEIRLKGLEEYSAEQVFFMTACLTMCEQDAAGRRHSPNCNAAVRNFAPFAEAFNCPLGSPMNLRDKCTLLTS
ncbi:endothelin-converting enzyme 2-like, partial [Rhipicephalus microplus]|uniref:endothelin-converting enzyme 2-like n=1 Tax=Rhipicephalus microplus TaxID=6941 RepID=UPI003F6D44ED